MSLKAFLAGRFMGRAHSWDNASVADTWWILSAAVTVAAPKVKLEKTCNCTLFCVVYFFLFFSLLHLI